MIPHDPTWRRVVLLVLLPLAAASGQPVAKLSFDDHPGDGATKVSVRGVSSRSQCTGVAGKALRFAEDGLKVMTLHDGPKWFEAGRSFSVQCWIRTTADSGSRMVLLTQKAYPDNGLASQKESGWAFYLSGGTWAWNIGTGRRRLTYERDNGSHMPLNDGRWHQLAMTWDHAKGQVWLYYDGVNRAIYNLRDSGGFDFTSRNPLYIGHEGTKAVPPNGIVPAIPAGAARLQKLVDAFNALGAGDVAPAELVDLVVDPRRLFDAKSKARGAHETVDFKAIARLESQLMRNPYTVHQAPSFMEVAPLRHLYSLVDGKVVVDDEAARAYSKRERLHASEFDIDELAVWDRALKPEEILAAYAARFTPARPRPLVKKRDTITSGVWNIFHGGLHFTTEEHGWDSRVAIAKILERENIDVVMMQETYSSGDFIAAQLGYYLATTVDWDNLNQGANISVLSRYPIREVRVPPGSAFMNVAARVAISETQDLWVMSNWYGMRQFPAVFEFHADRFAASATTPVLFGGDFNAVPHTDGGKSPASKALLGDGFTDAFRDLFPDVAKFPGVTHRGGRRIDQLFYKGASLRHTATKVIQTWPTGFPSDHYLIRSAFELR